MDLRTKLLLAVSVLIGLATVSQAQSCAYKDQLSDDPNDIGFYLYSNQGNPVDGQRIRHNDTASLDNSAFNRSAELTVFIIAGFTDNRTIHLPSVVVPAYLNSNRKYNLIVVDWGLLSGSCYVPFSNNADEFVVYSKVVTESVPIVAARTAEFIKFLNVDASKVHLLGHSLGAHVSGRVGNITQVKYNLRLARITGLDPAGPLFTLPNPQRKLDKNDAAFVDVVHTSMGGTGDVSIDGHVDFYPNGGIVQPGCPEDVVALLLRIASGKLISDIVDVESCSHQYAPILYAASLTKTFIACNCVDILGNLLTGGLLEQCILNRCPRPVKLGVDCPKTARGLYSLNTTNPP